MLLNQMPDGGNSVEYDQKLIRPGEFHNEIIHQIWDQSNKQFVCTCTETAQPGKDQEIVEIQRNMAKD